MKIRILSTLFAAVVLASSLNAGQFLLDFAGDGPNSSGVAAGWDAINNLDQDVAYALTDRSGSGDNDVTITALDDSFDPNNPAPPGVGTIYDGIDVPKEAVDDYLFKRADVAGTTARMRIDNLDAGLYNVTVFEGRTTDASQFGKLWLNDAEPAGENTGSFAQAGSTLTFSIANGDTLYYQHLEDGSGGISGMIINPVPEPASATLLVLGCFAFGAAIRRRS